MAGVDNLTPWKPGQSGNPQGSTRARRTKALLKEFIAEGMDSEIPEDLTERITASLILDNPKADREKLAVFAAALTKRFEGLKVGQAIAADVLVRALAGSMEDLRLIVSMEPKELELSGEVDTMPASAEFVPTEDETREWLELDRDGGSVH